MKPLTFAIQNETGSSGEVFLVPCPEIEITSGMWEELAGHFARESTLLPYPASILAQRWREGYSAVAIHGEHIIGYLSLAPITQCTPGSHSWTAISAALGLPPADFPDTDVYEFKSTWTDTAWRGKGLNTALHSPLVERYLQVDTLGLSGMIGLSSPVLARLGWQILAWDAALFVNSLIAVPFNEFPDQADMGWCTPAGLKLYQGPHIPLDDPQHPWNQYVYFWVSNPAVATQLNRELSDLLHGDLARWRRAIVATFARPGSSHRLAFLPG